MIYWITYSCFTCIEIICDLSMSWFPFFYEIKTIVLIWLLGQKGSMNLYKTLIHPVLIKKENVKNKVNHWKIRNLMINLMFSFRKLME